MRFLFAAFFITGIANAAGSAPELPDPQLTPGAVFHVEVATICQPGYARSARHVSTRTKHRVYAEYGITPDGQRYEVDHLIPLEIGGSNSIRNLWPEARFTEPWNALDKDKLERRLHALVCNGRLDLGVAQAAIASNWIEAYQKYMPHPKETPVSPTS